MVIVDLKYLRRDVRGHIWSALSICHLWVLTFTLKNWCLKLGFGVKWKNYSFIKPAISGINLQIVSYCLLANNSEKEVDLHMYQCEINFSKSNFQISKASKCCYWEIITHLNTDLSTKRHVHRPEFNRRISCIWSQCATTVLPRWLDVKAVKSCVYEIFENLLVTTFFVRNKQLSYLSGNYFSLTLTRRVFPIIDYLNTFLLTQALLTLWNYFVKSISSNIQKAKEQS